VSYVCEIEKMKARAEARALREVPAFAGPQKITAFAVS